MTAHEKAARALKARDEGMILLFEAPSKNVFFVRSWRSACSSHRQP
jgi:hypothetical protein